jgi:antitoxin (DNA-binding transcriptional repressor) of toxin-antitoxin stability system
LRSLRLRSRIYYANKLHGISLNLTTPIWSSKLIILERDMKQYNIAMAKAHFSKLVKMALLGEEIVIAKDNKPLLQLLPVDKTVKARRPGSAKGDILSVAADFNDTPEDFKEYS